MEISKAHRLLYWGTCHRAGTHGHPTAIHRATTEGRGQESSGQKSRPHSPSGQNRRGHFDPALRWCAQPQHPLSHAVPRRGVRRAPRRGGAIPFAASADECRTHSPGTRHCFRGKGTRILINRFTGLISHETGTIGECKRGYPENEKRLF